MAGQRTSSIDSGLLSSDVASSNRDQTALKPVFSSPGNNPNMSQNNQPPLSRRYTGPSQQRPRSAETAYNRRSVHEAPSGGTINPKEDSDSDLGIVPDVTKLLLGNRHRRSKATPATYSIHINTLYVYQQPTIPVENPMYQQLPVDRNDESPPSPCSRPAGYQYVWPTSRPEDFRHPQQHHDSTDVHRSRPTSLNVSSRTETPRNTYATSSKGHDKYAKLPDESMPQLIKVSSPTLSEGEEMEILIKGKSGKARRYKLHPIIEQSNDQDAYVMNASNGEQVVIQGLTINDHDEAFSESESIFFPESSSTSTVTSGTPSGVAIDTTVGDCKVTVNQTFQSTDNELGVTCTNQPAIRTSLSVNDISSGGAPPKTHPYHTESSPAVNQVPLLWKIAHHPFMQAKSMGDPTYFDFDDAHGSKSTKSRERQHAGSDIFSGNMSQSVPNIVLSSRIDTCYECRNQRRGGLFSSKHKSPRSCTLEGFHYITDELEISFMKEILDQKGKLGNWFITPTTHQPGYDSCLYVKTKREVTSFPVALNKKKKFFLDYNLKKSFLCLCKLTEFYKLNHLPSIKINLGQVLPNDAIPDMNFGADGCGTLMEQYAGIRM